MERATPKQRILVLEDDSSISELLTWILTDAGYHVTSVSSLQEARRECAGTDPDILITDLLLPDGLGSDLVDELKSRWHGNAPLTIMMSAVPQVRRHAQEVGADLCLTKPFDLTELLDAIADLNNSGTPELQPH